MSAEFLSKIYHDSKDPGPLSGVERLLRRARQLHVPGATRQAVQKYLKGEQAYTLHKPTRGRFTWNNTCRGSMLSGKPTWPICKVAPGRTVK